MKTLPPLVALLFLLGACASAPSGPVATIKGDPAGTEENYLGDEIHCKLEFIDGQAIGDSSPLSPGKHTLLVMLGNQGKTYQGVVRLLIPSTSTYRISARKKDEDAITVTLVDESTTIPVATSTAPLSSHMEFFVFVTQK
jgi:hypothetical protein